MLKKALFLIGMLIIISACVITSPAEMFTGTPTICVECVQQTLCAENVDDDSCQPVLDGTLLPPEEDEPSAVTDEPVDPSFEEATETPRPGYTKPTMAQFSTFTPTKTPTPTETMYITVEPTRVRTKTFTPSATKTSTPATWIYKPQKGAPKYTKNFAHPDLGCNWSGVSGQVFGKNNEPQLDVVAVITGDSNGTPVDQMGFAGASTAYGPGGFEMSLPVPPERTYATIDIQLFDLEGHELSKKYSFDTYSECTKNLVVFNFVLAY